MGHKLKLHGFLALSAATLLAAGCRSRDASALEPQTGVVQNQNAASSSSLLARLSAPFRARTATLAAGTAVSVRLEQRIDSDNNHAGDRFRTTLLNDLKESGESGALVAPAGSIVIGEITHVKEAGEVKGRAELTMELRLIEIGGSEHDFRSEPISIRSEGTKKDDAIKVGAGAAVGAVLGGILDGDDGAAKGAAVGAGTGLGYVLLTEGKDVEYEPGATLRFELSAPVKLPVSDTNQS